MLAKSLTPRTQSEIDITNQLWKCDQIARKMSAFTGLPYDELRDAAREYIVKIYSTWDSSKGANFSTWVNRCLKYHMMNYLRDRSRLVRIPRSYSDLYLRMRKHIRAQPDISPSELSKKLDVPVDKVRATLEAYSMKFSSNLDSQSSERSIYEDVVYSTNKPLSECFDTHQDLLFRISELTKVDEDFLIDFIVKKRALKTLLRKYPRFSSKQEIQEHADKLIEKILNG